MLFTKEVLDAAAGILLIAGFVPYIYTILAKGTRPTRATWIAWIVADGILGFSLYLKGELSGQMIGAIAGVAVVTVLSFWRGKPGWKLADKICLAGALGGLTVMLFLPEGDVHIYIMATSMLIAGIPTVFSVWEDYRREDLIGWSFWAASCVPALMALGPLSSWTAVGSAQQLSFAILDVPLVLLMLALRVAVKKGWKRLPIRSEHFVPPPAPSQATS